MAYVVLLLALLFISITSLKGNVTKPMGFRRSLIAPLATLLDINLPRSADIETRERRVPNQPSNVASSIYNTKDSNEVILDHNELAYRVVDCGNYISSDRIPQPERYNTKDWFHNLLNMRHSSVLKEIRGVILANTLFSMFVVFIQKTFHVTARARGTGFHSLLGGALGLLLVFRTNSSYSRFWEGRKILERILNSSRKLSRIFVTYQSVIDASKIDRVLHLIAAFPYVVEQHLKGSNNDENTTDDCLREILSASEIDQLSKIRNRPLYIISKISKEIAEIEEKNLFTNRERQLMQNYADELTNCLGSAERIVQTPVPLTYARHTSRFLSLYLLSLPVALVAEMGAAIVPFTCFATWSLFGILQIGHLIEDPFQSSLNFKCFSKTVKDDINELLFINNLELQRPLSM